MRPYCDVYDAAPRPPPLHVRSGPLTARRRCAPDQHAAGCSVHVGLAAYHPRQPTLPHNPTPPHSHPPQVWAAYSPVKNSPADAAAKAAAGGPSHSATTGELDVYHCNCRVGGSAGTRLHVHAGAGMDGGCARARPGPSATARWSWCTGALQRAPGLVWLVRRSAAPAVAAAAAAWGRRCRRASVLQA